METSRRVVLVTGASSGIGLACATRLADRGFRVYGTSRRAIPEPAASITMLRMDVTDEPSITQAIEFIRREEGRLDIVVNNAGVGLAGPIECTTLEEVRHQFEVNFFGTVQVCRSVLPILRAQRSGYIVNIGSIGGLVAIPFQSMYSATKFSLEGFTEALRYEVAPFGIKVVLMEPGDHKTSFTQNRQISEATGQDVVYAKQFGAALRQMELDEQNGPSPDGIAVLLERIVNTSRPRLRYMVGPPSQRAVVWLRRFGPYALFDYAMRRYYHLSDR